MGAGAIGVSALREASGASCSVDDVAGDGSSIWATAAGSAVGGRSWDHAAARLPIAIASPPTNASFGSALPRGIGIGAVPASA